MGEKEAALATADGFEGGSDIAVADGLSPDIVVGWLVDKSQPFAYVEPDKAAIAARIARQDFEAQTAESLFGGSATQGAESILGKPFVLLDVAYQRSSYEESEGGLPFYAVLTIADAEGTIQPVVTCGAEKVCRKAGIAKLRGWLPRTLKIVKDARTDAGFEPFNLVIATF